MNIKLNAKSIVITEIYDESSYEFITSIIEKAESKFQILDNNTKIRVTSNLYEFVEIYNDSI